MNDLTRYAMLCRQSYLGGSEWVDHGDLRYGIFEDTVCFRGSSNALNWIRDIRIRPALHNGRLAHAGFVSAFEELADVVLTQLKTTDITFTGHSLGAAIAVLFAEHLRRPAITFGCPRVWTRGCSIPVKNHRYVICDDDPVPMVPKLFYKPFNNPIVLTDQDHEIVNPGDHDIDVYIKRLTGGIEILTSVAGVKG